MKNHILIDKYLAALPDFKYRIQLKHPNQAYNPEKFDALNEYVDSQGLLKRTGYLKWRNSQGFNIYCRPTSLQYIFVDDIKEYMLDVFLSYKPCVVLESSPNNFQGFLKLDFIPETNFEATAISLYAVELFNADAGAARFNQVGRLPGYTNRKVKHQDQYGNYPWVKLIYSCHQTSTISPPKGGACKDYEGSDSHEFRTSKTKSPSANNDRSRADFRLACNLARKGYSEQAMYAELSKTEKGKERGKSYINFTIKNALKAVENDQNNSL